MLINVDFMQHFYEVTHFKKNYIYMRGKINLYKYLTIYSNKTNKTIYNYI